MFELRGGKKVCPVPLPTGRELHCGRTHCQCYLCDRIILLLFLYRTAIRLLHGLEFNTPLLNECSEPNLIERTRFPRILILSLDSMFFVSVTTLLSFFLITWKPPSLHVHRATAKMLLVLRTLVECDYSSLLETSSRVRYPIKSLMISSSDSSESLPRTSLFNLSSILTLICSSWSA